MKRLDELVKILQEGDTAEQISAARELEALGPSALATLPHVLDCLPTAGTNLQKALLNSLVGFGPRALPEITRRVQDAPEPAKTALLNAEHHVAERLGALLEKQARLRNWTARASGLLGFTLLRFFAGPQLYEKG
ncbi:hypothetical protein, partial [Archangium violaceum]|uniref:hypothetical protein n=1 Tax=Archangium violaceum TaxID=83451 RepID=UPI0005BDBE99